MSFILKFSSISCASLRSLTSSPLSLSYSIYNSPSPLLSFVLTPLHIYVTVLAETNLTICNFSLQANLALSGCFAVLFIFYYQNDGVPLWNICTKFHCRRSFLSAIKYRCIVYDLYVRRTPHGKLAIRISGNLVDMMRCHGCRNFSGENELIVRIPSI